MFHADDFVLCLCHCPCDCINCRDYARADAEPICVMGLQFTRSVQRLPFDCSYLKAKVEVLHIMYIKRRRSAPSGRCGPSGICFTLPPKDFLCQRLTQANFLTFRDLWRKRHLVIGFMGPSHKTSNRSMAL